MQKVTDPQSKTTAKPDDFSIEIEESHSAIFEAANDAILILDVNYRVRRANAIAESLYGYSFQDLQNKSLYDLRPLETPAAIDEQMRYSLHHNGARWETCHVRNDGTVFPVEISSKPFRTGEQLHFIHIVRDISERKHREEALRASEAELRDFVDNAAEGMHWVGPDGRILWANQTELNMLGYLRDEYIGHHIAEFHNDPSVIEDILTRLSRGEILESYEARLRCKDGSVRHVLINSSVLFQNGEFIHTRCFTRDITERKQAEDRLRENERRFREMIDALPTPIYTTDAQGRLTHFNPAAVEFAGHVPVLGSDQWYISWKMYRPDGTPLPHDECPMAIALKEGRMIRGAEAIAERPDGTRIWSTHYPTVLRNAEGQIVGGINMLVDITERRQGETTKAHLAAIVNSSDDAILSIDLDGRIQTWNRGAEEIFGYKAAEVIGIPVELLIPTARREEESHILQRICSGERFNHYETVRQHKDGRLIDVSLTISPMRDGQGRIIGASKITRNITKQKLIQLREQQLFKLATAVNRAHALPDLYKQALDAIARSLNVDRAAILLFDLDGIMRFKEWRGLSNVYRQAVEGHSPWKPDAPSPEPIVINDVEQADLPVDLKAVILKEGIRALAFIPLTYGQRLIGKFMVYFPEPRCLDREELQLAQAIADTLALGIERRRTEEIVKQRETQLRQALEAGRMGSWEWDLATNKVYWSPALEAIHGLAPGTFDGSLEAYQRDIHPEDRERVLTSISKTLEGGGTEHHIEYRIVTPNGSERWVEGKGTLYRTPEGVPTKLIGVCSDITELKQSQLRLKNSAENLERQVTLRTAELLETQERLRALATELNLAEQRERKRLATELHDHLQQTLVLGKFKVGHAKRLFPQVPECLEMLKQFDEVFTDALSYTRTLVAELSPPVLREHGLPAGLRWLAEHMKKHHMIVIVNVPEHLHLTLPEDQAVLLFQSVRELLINTAKHARTNHASVTVQQYGDYLSIRVRDEGQGFDPSRRSEPREQSSQFGLFSIKERMKALRGSFTIESAPGHGTTAILTLPFAPMQQVQITYQDSRTLASSENGKSGQSMEVQSAAIRLLLVDDHAMMRQGLRTTLEHYADILLVGEAKDGQEAIDLVEKLRPQVVIMDVNMPRLNGIDATACIKAHYPDICIIGISVNAGEDNQEAMRQAGATLLITKEAAVDELYHAIRAGLNLPVLSPRIYDIRDTGGAEAETMTGHPGC